MIKASKATLIIKNEIKNGLVKVHRDPTNQFCEYWVYQDEKSGTINSRTGNYQEASASVDSALGRVLRCVVVCENNPSRIIKNKKEDKFFTVKGFIFNDEEYPDLLNYLSKTERHT